MGVLASEEGEGGGSEREGERAEEHGGRGSDGSVSGRDTHGWWGGAASLSPSLLSLSPSLTLSDLHACFSLYHGNVLFT